MSTNESKGCSLSRINKNHIHSSSN